MNSEPFDLWDDSNFYLRDKYNGSWQSKQTVYPIWCLTESVIADDSYLHAFYFDDDISDSPLYHRKSTLGSTTWSTPEEIYGSDMIGGFSPDAQDFDYNGDLHLVYPTASSGLYYTMYDGSSWAMGTDLDGANSMDDLTFTLDAVENDVYVFWVENDRGQWEIHYRQLDANPITPTGLSISNSGGHPRLDWDVSKEVDFDEYKLYRQYDGGAWSLIASLDRETNYHIDTNTDYSTSKYDPLACYKLRSVDVEGNYSSYTSAVCCHYDGISKSIAGKQLQSAYLPDQYELLPAYPNPFNPSTSLDFMIPCESNLRIHIYDLSGQKVRTLWDSSIGAGYHTILWDGRDDKGRAIPSGMYLISFRAVAHEEGETFESIQRVMLLK